MINWLKEILGLGDPVNFKELINNGALILDVRNKSEYSLGSIKGSLNIPLDQLGNNLSKLPDKNKPIITCCASGVRSASAKSLLKSKGYKSVHNGEGWTSLRQKM